ncbi:MAG TPA: helix-turn-helix transcriptional regulator [Coriobacteriia bacterium]
MTKVRRSGYVFVTWKGDHAPRHVPVGARGLAVNIECVRLNNRRRAFEFETPRGAFSFPYAKADPAPTPADPVVEFFIDEELAGEAVTYRLASGREGFVHVEMVFDYNREPAYMRDLLLYRLTVEAQDRLAASGLSHRELIRRLGTSPAQFYRLLDQTNYRKSVDKVLALLQALDCDVDLVVTARS